MDTWLEQATVHPENFAYRDLIGIDRWDSWVVAFGSLTIVGAPTYTGLYRFVGAECRFQVQFSAATSIESTAGTDYLTLPVAAKGLDGQATMTNKTAHTAVGDCEIDTVNSRCWLPSQVASGNVFKVSGWFQIAG